MPKVVSTFDIQLVRLSSPRKPQWMPFHICHTSCDSHNTRKQFLELSQWAISTQSVLFAVRQVYQDYGLISSDYQPGGLHRDQPSTLHISEYCASYISVRIPFPCSRGDFHVETDSS